VVGLDPNDGTDTDEDGDSLPDKVEQGPGSGWEVRTFGVSTSPFQQGAPTTIIGHSRTDSVDSDEDGLTDYEEFFLKTNAESKDTDGDGIEDRIEHLGYFLGHDVGGKDIGIIKTDPLDADTDNDKRSDGAEAELKDIELARWVVRVDGQAPRQVFSNPLVADADFDFLVDGDEFAFGTDPNNGNTDGDARDDGKEFTAGTNPLVEDFQVTVYFTSITITDNGDGGSNAGDIGFDLGIRKPDSSQPAGLSSIFTSAVRANLVLTDPFTSFLTGGTSEIESRLPLCDKVGSDAFDCSLQNNDSVDLDNDPNTPPTAIYGIPFADGATLRLPGLLPENLRSVSFGMTKNDFFAIEGVIVERDSGPGDTYVYLGGLEGVRAEEKAMDDEGNEVTTTIRPVFHGQDLLASPQRFHDLTFTFTTADNIAGGNERIAGSVSLFFIVS
jgi:hypothetical protein